MNYGYARVSTKEQHVDRQMAALNAASIPVEHIFCDYQSGKDFERKEYQRLLSRLKPGDLLVVKSIDRLGRNYEEILVQWQYITKEIGADIQVLDMELLNTRGEKENLTTTLISDLVLQIMAYLAQTERDFIRQRQEEGITAAKARGVIFGAPPVELPEVFDTVYEKWANGEVSSREGAKMVGMSHSTFFRRCRKRQEKAKEAMAIIPENDG